MIVVNNSLFLSQLAVAITAATLHQRKPSQMENTIAERLTQKIEEQINENGEVILLLGVRRAESTSRAARLEKRKKVEDLLYPHDSLKNCHLYAPIEDWSNDEVWIFLNQNKNPWGTGNQELQNLYASATEDKECPVVVDTTTPSCGNSRFGC